MEFLKKFKIILASASPRRQKLLEDMGLEFEVRPRSVPEDFPPDMKKEDVAVFLSKKKAMDFTPDEIAHDELIIAADTIVCLDDEILNKPGDRAHAIEMLTMLSGKKHEVITGVSIRTHSRMHSFYVSTEVYFKNLSKGEIDYYIDSYKPFDKAGSYGIQEWIGYVGIEKIEGSYFNVVGLPTARLYDELMNFVS